MKQRATQFSLCAECNNVKHPSLADFCVPVDSTYGQAVEAMLHLRRQVRRAILNPLTPTKSPE